MLHIVPKIFNWLFPPVCLHCQREGRWLCSKAQAEVKQLPPLINPVLIEGVDTVICCGSYDLPILQALITGIKYQYFTAYQEILPPLLSGALTTTDVAGAVIIPVPLHKQREKRRGFNQSRLIAQALAGLSVRPITEILTRTRSTSPQARLKAHDRIRNISNAFILKPGVEKVPFYGILVDDVITTGSTIRECALVLRQAGMKHIIAVALAKG